MLSMEFEDVPNFSDYGITENLCWPSTLINDLGFALLLADKGYKNHEAAKRTGN